MDGVGHKLWGFDGTKWVPLAVDANGFVKLDLGAVHLGDLGDVSVAAPGGDEFLYWNAVAGEWQAKVLPAAAGGVMYEAAQIGTGATYHFLGIVLDAAGEYAVISFCAPSDLAEVDAALLIVRYIGDIVNKKVTVTSQYGQIDNSEAYNTHSSGVVDKTFSLTRRHNQTIDLTADFAAMTAGDAGWVQIAYKDTPIGIAGLLLEYH